jgi:hypothetical protein
VETLRPILAGCFVAIALAKSATGEPPRVHFDMPFTIACRDVTPHHLAAAYPNHRLVEARFEISSLLLAGKEQDLTQIFVRIDSPERTVSVVDYLPKTLHESRLASPIGISKTDERNASIGINVAGQYEILTTLAANAGLSQKTTSCVKYDLLPPLETVAASGTLLRGAGVFFKLKGSERRLLEGASEFALVLKVDRDWRTDHVRVLCTADGVQRGFVSSLDQSIRSGQREFAVALYLEGDEAARVTAEEFASQRSATNSRTSAKAALKPAAWIPRLD